MNRARNVVALALVCLAAGAAQAQQWRGPASLAIEVKGKPRGNVADALVILRYQQIEPPGGPRPVLTDSAGRAVLVDLAEGVWEVEVSHDDFLSFVALVLVDSRRKPEVQASFLQASGSSLTPIRVRFADGKGKTPSASVPLPPEAAERLARRRPPQPPAGTTAPAPADRPAGPSQPVMPEPELRPLPEPVKPEPQAPPTTPEPPAEPVPAPAPEPRPATAEPAPPPPREPQGVATPPAPAPRPSPQPQPPAAAPPAEAPPAPAVPMPDTPAPTAPASPTPAPIAPEPEPAPAVPEPEPAPAVAEPAPQSPVEPPAPEPSPPAPVVVPVEPQPEPPQPPTPTATAALPPPGPLGPTLRAYRDRTCVECRPGEWALSAEAVVGPAAAPCDGSLEAHGRELAALLGSSVALELKELAGPAAQALGEMGAAEPSARVAELLGDGSQACRIVAAVIPKAGRFRGLRMEAADASGIGDCQADRPCPVGRARWIGQPRVAREPSANVIWGLFVNEAPDRARRARLTVYFAAPYRAWDPSR